MFKVRYNCTDQLKTKAATEVLVLI